MMSVESVRFPGCAPFSYIVRIPSVSFRPSGIDCRYEVRYKDTENDIEYFIVLPVQFRTLLVRATQSACSAVA